MLRGGLPETTLVKVAYRDYWKRAVSKWEHTNNWDTNYLQQHQKCDNGDLYRTRVIVNTKFALMFGGAFDCILLLLSAMKYEHHVLYAAAIYIIQSSVLRDMDAIFLMIVPAATIYFALLSDFLGKGEGLT
ncbi:hypothetical protein G9A89_016637 [Geosiphon pyriformis]|nr:hypothetical protein G9A89_016637 [Geosiphon pyriformis]